MQLVKYLQQRVSGLIGKVRSLSTGNNGAFKFDITITTMFLFQNENGLVEVEVKEDKDRLGWVYRDDIDFFMIESSDELVEFKKIKTLVESMVKVHGKVYSDSPKLYHIRRGEFGSAYYYLHENDIKCLI